MHSLDFSNVDRVEEGIVVNFSSSVTVPVLKDGSDSGLAVYLGVTKIAAFAREVGGDPEVGIPELLDVAGRLDLAGEVSRPGQVYVVHLVGSRDSDTGHTERWYSRVDSAHSSAAAAAARERELRGLGLSASVATVMLGE